MITNYWLRLYEIQHIWVSNCGILTVQQIEKGGTGMIYPCYVCKSPPTTYIFHKLDKSFFYLCNECYEELGSALKP